MAAFVVVCALTVAACDGGSDNEDDGAEAGQGTAITDVASTTSDAPVTAAPTTGVATATQPPTSDAPTTAAPTTLAQPTTTLDPVLEAISDGYVARCSDGGLSDNTDFGATCSGGDGIDEWLAPFGECEDGTIIAMSEDASCSDHDGFRTLLEPDYKPTPRSSDIAKCQSGVYSDNVDFAATCTGNGGVDEWLAAYGKCEDGTVIVMSKDASCSGHGEFRKLLRPDYKPTRRAADVARCKNGLFSDNTDFAATCSSNGGVDKWLATYGKCLDGTVIKINADASCSGSGGFDKLLPEDYQPPTTTTTATEPAATTTEPGSNLTPSQQNAVRSAQSYLEFSGFSRQGLIDQLSSEFGDQYPVEDATVAVDSLNVDWTAQAVESAQSYLEFSGFSRQGLIGQLSSEFGDQYTVDEATLAVSSLDVDWNAEAAESAQSYLESSGFSCQELIEQLSSEFGDQYTVEEATFGATQAGVC